MVSIVVKFRPSTVHGKEGTLYYQVIHARVVRQVKTIYKIFSYEWDSRSREIQIPLSTIPSRRNYLLAIKANITSDRKRMERSVSFLERNGTEYTADDIISTFLQFMYEGKLFSFMQNTIERLKRLDKIRTAETYTCALNSLMRFRKNMDIFMDEIDSDLMEAYEAWLKEQGICLNTVSFYMRILRAVYNRGVEKGLTTQQHPFKHVYTGIEKTVKRAVPLKIIKIIKHADLRIFSPMDYARDMFMVSFYTRGMSFVDMAYLKKTDLNNGILSYRRKKTGQQLFIRWEDCMQKIVDKYPRISTSPYLLPIIKNPEDNPRKQYKNAILSVNKNLKSLSKMLGLSTMLTTYVARHSWASIAKSKNIPLSVISEGMGHDSETTTQIYLTSLDTAVVDKANSVILRDL